MGTSLHQAVIRLSEQILHEWTEYKRFNEKCKAKNLYYRISKLNYYDKLFPEKTFCLFCSCNLFPLREEVQHWLKGISGGTWCRSQGSIPTCGCRLPLVHLQWDFLAECRITACFISWSLLGSESFLRKRITPSVALEKAGMGKAKNFWWWHVRGPSFCLMKPHEETFITGRELKHWPLPGNTGVWSHLVWQSLFFLYLSLVFCSIGDCLLYEQACSSGLGGSM